MLRDLGLSLKGVKALLDGGPPSLSDLLTRQQEVLEQRRREITGAIALLASARRRIASGQALAPDDLIHLSRETVMTHLDHYTAVEGRIEEHLQRHVPADAMRAVKDGVRARLAEAGMSERDVIGELDILLTEARRLMTEGDPYSEAAKSVVRRWLAFTRNVQRPPPEIVTGWRTGMSEAMADPSLAPELPFDPEVLAFIKRVAEGMKMDGEPA